MKRVQWIQCGVASFLISLSAHAQSPAPTKSPATSAVGIHTAASSNLLRELDSSLQNVVAKVSPSVVQIVVNGYGPSEDHGHTDTAKIARQHSIGAGIIVDPDGYIMTNAHVV